MGKKLPEEIVRDLNAVGLGGRLVYVPLVKKTVSDEIYEAMTSMFKVGESINIDNFQNLVNLRTLYRLRTKATAELGRSEKEERNE